MMNFADICSEEPPVGQTMTKYEVRRAFAYRFYDSNLGGFFEKVYFQTT